MTRPSDYTRERIMKAAVSLFAARGYDGASVRAIVEQAGVNQAAINYHFGGKAGLYRTVLKAAFDALTKDESLDAGKLAALPREEALRRFVRQQLRPLLSRDELSRYIRIFGWETLRPTVVMRKFMAEETTPFMTVATDLVRRFLPAGASEERALLAAVWLMGQCSVFVRNREQLSGPPLRLAIDEALVGRLVDTVSRWAIGGLTAPA